MNSSTLRTLALFGIRRNHPMVRALTYLAGSGKAAPKQRKLTRAEQEEAQIQEMIRVCEARTGRKAQRFGPGERRR